MDHKQKRLHMIGNAHIDPVWLWQWQEGYQETKATFRSALDRMNEYPEFVFAASSAAIYAWIEESDPEMFNEIKQRVQEGRWKIVGGWWIEPDCNIPSGESFVRQGLHGQRFFNEKLGVTATVGYNVDSFGHNGMLPQILRKSRMPYYVFMRPSPHEKGLPGRLFWWEADDGSRVLAFRIAYEYGSWGKELSRQVTNVAAELKDPIDELMCFYGVGNHGGGPTKENLDSIIKLREDPQMPDLLFGSPDQFFTSVLSNNPAFPVVHEDLQHHASGCYSVHSGVKKWNRMAENRLLAAEKYATVAQAAVGHPYSTEFERAWKNVLFNQFHDILAGTSLEEAYEDTRNQFGEALAIADRVQNSAIQVLAWNVNVDPEPGIMPIIVFNPHAWQVKANIELEIGGSQDGKILIDDQGHAIAHQFVQSHATTHFRQRLSFVADLPALGYRLYRMVERKTDQEFQNVSAGPSHLENNRFFLQFDPETGYITNLKDKETGAEVFRAAAAVPVVIHDPTDTWSHNTFIFNNLVGKFKASKLELVERGKVKSVLRVTSQYNQSTLIQDFTVYNDLDIIEVKATVDWHEQHKMLKLRFPVNIHQIRANYEIPFGHIERMANGEEEPGQSWIDLSGVSPNTGYRYGLSILNDCKYSFDVNLNDVGMTILRSPIYAHHDPMVPDPGRSYTYMDQGVHKFSYTLFAHKGSWDEAGTVRRAAELNQPPTALVTTVHPGSLPHSNSFASVEPENLIISALKQAEDNDDVILRCYETSGVATSGVIHLPFMERQIKAGFGPYEIKTFRIPRDTSLPVVETDLLEWLPEDGS